MSRLKTKRSSYNYMLNLEVDLYEDLKLLQKLDPSRSIKSLLSEGVRVVVSARIQEMLEYKQDQETLRGYYE